MIDEILERFKANDKLIIDYNYLNASLLSEFEQPEIFHLHFK